MPRVIAGTARGIPLKTLDGEATRPTADRTKEAIFSSLGTLVVDARVLDLCAGSGQLGIEALSRGAKSAVFVDQSRAACSVIQENLARTRLGETGEVICREVIRAAEALLAEGRSFDLIFFDPPYALAGKLLPPLAGLVARGLLWPDGDFVVEEASKNFKEAEDLPLACLKRRKYGAAMISYYSRLDAWPMVK